MKCLFKRIFTFIILVFVLYLNMKLNLYGRTLEAIGKRHQIPNVKIFNLQKPLKPAQIYSSIKCRKSARFYDVAVSICVHDLNKDKYVRYVRVSSTHFSINCFISYINFKLNLVMLHFFYFLFI